MIPEFPNFKKIEMSDKIEVEKFVSKFPSYSAFNFTNLFVWDIRNDRKISKLNDNLVILFTDYDTSEPFLSFLGDNECNDTVLRLLNFAKMNKIFPQLRFITQESIKRLTLPDLQIHEDRDNFDYIFSISELANLKGIKFKKHRHLASKFSKEYPEAVFRLEDLRNPLIQKKIIKLLERWENCKKKQNKTYDLRFEKRALNYLLENSSNFQLVVSCIFIYDEMIGFSIDEILPNKSTMSHFIKADNSYRGIYEFLNTELANYLLKQKIELWNWQQDLSLINLRETKLGYRPVGFLKRYIVSLN